MKALFLLVLTVFWLLLNPAMAGPRQLGQSCAISTTDDQSTGCTAGLQCVSGTCTTGSFLKTSAACKTVMNARGFNKSSYSVQGGFCWNSCPDLDREMGRSVASILPVTYKLFPEKDPIILLEKFSALSNSDFDIYKAAVNACMACGSQCAMGPDFNLMPNTMSSQPLR